VELALAEAAVVEQIVLGEEVAAHAGAAVLEVVAVADGREIFAAVVLHRGHLHQKTQPLAAAVLVELKAALAVVDDSVVEAAGSEEVEELPAALEVVRQVVMYNGTGRNHHHLRHHYPEHCGVVEVQVVQVVDHEARLSIGD
jgi:hypothetical protein